MVERIHTCVSYKTLTKKGANIMARHKDELSSFFGLQLDDDQQHYLDLLQDDSVRLVMV